MKVRAKLPEGQFGYYNYERRRNGDVFEISDATYAEDVVVKGAVVHKKGDVKAFSSIWMERVSDEEPADPAMAERDRQRRRYVDGAIRKSEVKTRDVI